MAGRKGIGLVTRGSNDCSPHQSRPLGIKRGGPNTNLPAERAAEAITWGPTNTFFA
jgi:hypothetical protein